MKMVELLLTEHVNKLGKRGSVVKVKPGYARNFLIPKGLGIVVTSENLQNLEVEKKRIQQREKAEKEEYKKMAEKLSEVSCPIEVNANEEGHLFGSVTYAMIAEAFNNLGYDIKPTDIELQDEEKYPIKEVGIYPIKIRLHSDVKADSKVWVVQEQA